MTPYAKLTHREQAEYMGRLIIAVQHDPQCYRLGLTCIALAEFSGIYDRVTLGDNAEALRDLDNKIENGPGGN